MKKMTIFTLKQIQRDIQREINYAKSYDGKCDSACIGSIQYNQWIRQINAINDAIKSLKE